MDLLSGNLSDLEKSFDNPTNLDENNTDISMDETLVSLLPTLCQNNSLMMGTSNQQNVKCLSASAPQMDQLLQPEQHNEEDTLMANGFDTITHPQQESTRYNTSTSDLLTKVPSPTTSTSLPTSKPDVIHYHYHYHMQNKKRQMLANTNAALQKAKRSSQQVKRLSRKAKRIHTNVDGASSGVGLYLP